MKRAHWLSPNVLHLKRIILLGCLCKLVVFELALLQHITQLCVTVPIVLHCRSFYDCYGTAVIWA